MKLLTTVVHSQLLYAAPIWYDALQHEVNRNKLFSPQRKMALRVASAYCTVSYAAIMVVAGIIPIHLLAAERLEIEQARIDGRDLAEAKREAMNNWQAEWDRNGTGSWTRRLIPRIDVWKNRRWGQLSYHVTQFLTGHGCFNEYLLRFKKRENAVCMYCDHPNDDVEHTFIGCDRRILEVELGSELTPEMMVECMLQSKKKWDRVVKFIIAGMTRKEVDERAVQSAAAAAIH